MDYLSFFGFQDAPFRLTPDPQFFFPSYTHQEALQTLLYSVRAGEGFIQITGDPGTGKTLLLRTLLKELGDDVKTALILNPNLSPQDLLRVILDDFAITNNDQDIFNRPKDQLIRLFRDFLLLKAEEGCKAVIIIDEAQNLPLETIEELRLLSNLETDKQKLLQIFLVGQRELEKKIEDASLRQLSQRITIRYCLMPFNRQESATYIDHRLKIAAPCKPAIFTPEIIDLIYKFSQGTPRLINIICERTLMAAYIDGQTQISKNHYNNAIISIKGEHAVSNPQNNEKNNLSRRNGLLIALLLIIAATTYISYQSPQIRGYFLPTTSTASKTKTTPTVVAAKKNQTLMTENRVSPPAPAHSEESKKELLTTPASKTAEKTLEVELENPKPTPENEALSSGKAHVTSSPAPLSLQSTNEDRDPTLKLPTTKTLPAALIGFPLKAPLLVASEGELLADLWLKEDNNSTPAITNQLPLPAGLRSGLLVVGLNQTKPFLFNPLNFLYGEQLQLPDNWNIFFSETEMPVVPLIILPGRSTMGTQPAIFKNEADNQTGEQLSQTIKEWATAWRNQDLDKFMTFYAPVMTIYEPGRLKPLTFEKKRLKKIKAQLFQKTESLKLKLSEPLCLTDPINPNLAMAFFFQNYQSKQYQDRGYKALFLSRTQQGEEPCKWKISAKFFVPIK